MRLILPTLGLVLLASCSQSPAPPPVVMPPSVPPSVQVPLPAPVGPPPVVESPGPTGPVYKHGYHHYAHKYHGHNVYYKPPAKHRKRHGVPLSNNPHN